MIDIINEIRACLIIGGNRHHIYYPFSPDETKKKIFFKKSLYYENAEAESEILFVTPDTM